MLGFRVVYRRRRRTTSVASQRRYKLYKEEARALVHAKLSQFNEYYKHPLKKVFIKNHRARWGSCSSRGNLNFNYKILFLPEALQDYLIVHELAHLKFSTTGRISGS
jgi:predicted metal-dependent hydrolase